MRLRIVFGPVLLFWLGGVHADSAGEREQLARLAHEIEALNALVDAAEREADYPQRIRFQYAWLRQDLERVRLGILDHLQAPLGEPRRIPPLSGDYRR